jgi:LysR family transcriptional regulator, chromosome initiation inhibitor
VQGHLASGRLVELMPGRALHVALHWQHPRHAPPMLQRLTDAVLAAARAQLEPIESNEDNKP